MHLLGSYGFNSHNLFLVVAIQALLVLWSLLFTVCGTQFSLVKALI